MERCSSAPPSGSCSSSPRPATSRSSSCASGAYVLDSTGAQALGDLITHLQHHHVTVLLSSVNDRHRQLINHLGVLDRLTDASHLLPTFAQALEHARSHCIRNRAMPLRAALGHS